MKYIALLLLSFNLQAEIYIKRVTSEQTGAGYMFKFQKDGIQYCWGMPDMLDQSFVPETWTEITQAAQMHNWPFMTGDAAIACNDGPPVYKTIGSPIWSIMGNLTVQQVGTVPSGIPCGDQAGSLVFVRAVTHAGIIGSAICFLM